MRRKVKAWAILRNGQLIETGIGIPTEIYSRRKCAIGSSCSDERVVPCVVTFDDGKRKRKKAR